MTTVTISYLPVPAVFGFSPHGLLAAVGIFAGYWVLRRGAERRGIPLASMERGLLWAVPAGVIGARADFVLSHLGQFHTIGSVLAIWQGGLALFGGLLAGTAAGLVVLRRDQIRFGPVLDLAGPAIAIAIAIGRIGDLLLTDHLGKPVSSGLSIAYRVPVGAHLAPGFGSGPAQLPPVGETCSQIGRFFAGCTYQLTPAYDLIGALALFGFLVFLTRRPHPVGAIFALFVVGYASQRLLIDVTRAVDERPLWGMTGTQLVAVVLALCGVGVLGWLYGRDARILRRSRLYERHS